MNIFILLVQILILLLSPQSNKYNSNQIKVYLQIGISQNEISEIEQKIRQLDHVVSVKYPLNI